MRHMWEMLLVKLVFLLSPVRALRVTLVYSLNSIVDIV